MPSTLSATFAAMPRFNAIGIVFSEMAQSIRFYASGRVGVDHHAAL